MDLILSKKGLGRMSQQKTKKQIQDKKVKEWQKQNRAGYKRKKRKDGA